ncbi:MAG: large subunit ribosomal protein L29 [Glaciecola sp.]|jgi:large subunit ribosomal protein L29
MKENKLADLSAQELQGKIEEGKKSLASFKLNHAVSPLENPMVIRNARRDVARLKTELNKRSSN